MIINVSEADLSALKQAEAYEASALQLRMAVYEGWAAQGTPVDPPPVDPVDPPPVDPPIVWDTLPAFKSGELGAISVYDLTGKFFAAQLNLRRLSFVHVIGGTYDTPDTSFYVDGGSDIIVEGATFTGPPMQSSNTQRCRIINSTRVTMDKCVVIGGLATNGIAQDAPPPLDASGNVIGLGAGKGVNLDNCTDCVVRTCDISLVHKGITVGKSVVEVSDNFIHDIRTTPISGVFGNGSVILGNTTRTSKTWGYGGNYDHGDMLHIWTEGGDIDGLVIAENRFEQGEGSPIMGIFLQAKNGGFTNLDARNNYISTANGQGWRVDGCSGLIDGTVLDWPGDHADPKSEPRLDVNAPSHDIAINNTVGIVTVDKGLTNVTVNGVPQ